LASIAGAIADEVKIGGSANPAMAKLMREWTSAGAISAGRQGEPGIVVGAVTVVDEDASQARARARREVALYLDVVGRLDPTVEIPAELLEDLGRALRDDGPEGAAKYVPDEILDLFAFAGTPMTVAEQAIALIEAGAERVEFGTPHGLSDDRGVELLGSKVLPAVREHFAAREVWFG
jgi:5,10-methylenetetrahydromethanopterin reductase